MQYFVDSVLPAPDSPDITIACLPYPEARPWNARPAKKKIWGAPLVLPAITESLISFSVRLLKCRSMSL